MMKCKRFLAVAGLFAALFFCCGTVVSAAEPEDVNSQVLERPILNRGQTAIIGYLGWIGFLIAMIGGDRKEEYAKSHLNQSLLMNIVATCAIILYSIGAAVVSAGVVMSAYSYAMYGRGAGAVGFGVFLLVLGLAALIFTIVMWFFGLIRACRGNNKPVLLFGRFRPMK